jgi:dipeptidase D
MSMIASSSSSSASSGSSVLSGLEPRALWAHFEALSGICRPSGGEAGARDFVLAWARDRGFAAQADESGNVLVRVPARSGQEARSPVVLQAHLDMVCEPPDHDFSGGVKLKIDGAFVTADGTTLGADDGIGVAAAMALAEDPALDLGPLELLFTADEERGLNGARGLASGLLAGRRMVNLDAEDDGVLFVGCAGSGDVTGVFPTGRRARPAGSVAVRVQVDGGTGGHSGLEIHENRANAIVVLARVLDAASRAGITPGIMHIDGGSRRNAIPSAAHAGTCVSPEDCDRYLALVAAEALRIREEFAASDPELRITTEIRQGCRCQTVLSAPAAVRVLGAILATPSGVVAMSRDIPGLVETSNNLGVVTTGDDEVTLVNGTRSSIAAALEALRRRIGIVYELAGGDVRTNPAYAGWKPDLGSALLAVAREARRELFGEEARVLAVHAGLECGIVGERYPGMDMIALGPDVRGAHSVHERVDVASVARFYAFVAGILERLH